MVVRDLPKIRMLVLETDETILETAQDKGYFGQILHHHFSKAGLNHNPPLGVETDRRFVVAEKGGKVPTYDEVKDYHAVLMTGSMFDAHGDNPWILDLMNLLREIWLRNPECKLSGVCFGHQLLCRLFGSIVEPESSGKWELGHSRIDLTEVGKRLFDIEEPYVYLHQMHQDHVISPPSPESSGGLLSKDTKVHVWGSSPHTQVQGIFIEDRVFTTQAHLAFDEDMVHREIQVRVDSGSLTDLEHADRAKDTAHLEHDGDIAAAAILRFFHGEDSKAVEEAKKH
ncbi:hypothetical protein PG990_010062 [Apiospora arundinis]|uniref:Class I glutamine amidotransferase-like protein n=1 Tax=Apiospora arundinis TaxID=335852 RepID=A0ABR2IVL2_9PEZI